MAFFEPDDPSTVISLNVDATADADEVGQMAAAQAVSKLAPVIGDALRKQTGITRINILKKEFDAVLSSVQKRVELEEAGFPWKYYGPYYQAMVTKELTGPFFYFLFRTVDPDKSQEWLQANRQLLESYLEWEQSYQWPDRIGADFGHE